MDLLEVRLRMIVVLRNTKQVRFGVQLPAMNNKMILEGKVTGPRNYDSQETSSWESLIMTRDIMSFYHTLLVIFYEEDKSHFPLRLS